jgi:DNA replication protein DnaC
VAEMMSERIVRNARELKLLGLAENLDELVKRGEEEDLGYREFLDLLLEEEVGVVEGRKYASRLKLSGLPYRKTLSQFDRSITSPSSTPNGSRSSSLCASLRGR